jgi:hypothetical protein
MPSKPFLVFWYILSACALGTQRNILHHWASTQIRLGNMLKEMSIDQKSTKSPSHRLDTKEKVKQQQTENHELFCAPQGKSQKKSTKHQEKRTATDASEPSL